MKLKTKQDIRQRIKGRIRKKISGTPERPRLAVYRSQSHIYAQLIDDEAGRLKQWLAGERPLRLFSSVGNGWV